MTGKEPSRENRWISGVLTWLFRALLIAALIVLAFAWRGNEAAGFSGRPVQTYSQVDAKDSGFHSSNLTVLTFNVAGLPWPVSNRRADFMPAIGRQIKALSVSGTPVDVVLIQEGFIVETEEIADALAFRYRIKGAGPELKSVSYICAGCEPDTRQRKWWKGEGIGAVTGSGLHIFSAHPIYGVSRMAFGKTACAGYDCLANKGAVRARIVLPGVPRPIDVLTTHLNSTNAAGVPKWETHVAHERQVRRLADFWDTKTDLIGPTVIGGDFNIRGSHQRFLPLAKLLHGATFVKNTCKSVGGPTVCDIDVRPDTPWLTSQDLQAFRSGRDIDITPVLAKTVLNEPVNGTQLSDHFGFLVQYRLSWRPGIAQDPVYAEVIGDSER